MPRSRHRAPDDEAARIRRKNDALFVPVRSVNARNVPTVDVASLAALVDVAKKYETVILELPVAAGWEYLLWDDGALFRYRREPPAQAAAEKATPKPATPPGSSSRSA